MRLFLETSGLLKVLLREDLSDLAREAFSQAQAHAASAFALPEAVGVFHAMQRDGRLTRPLYRKALRELYELWEYLEVLTPTLEGHMRAARLCERHPLKGADAVHLEGALFLKGLYPDTAHPQGYPPPGRDTGRGGEAVGAAGALRRPGPEAKRARRFEVVVLEAFNHG